MAKKQDTESHEIPQNPVHVISQYVKDMSFENPGATIANAGDNRPDINIQIETNAEKLNDRGERIFEVALKIKVDAKQAGKQMFLLETEYGGIFEINAKVPEEYIHPLVMVECPRIIFPFVRAVVASAIQEGGYPSLLLAPVDFASLYQQQMQKLQEEQQKAAKN